MLRREDGTELSQPGGVRWSSWGAAGVDAVRSVARSERLAAVFGADLRALAALRIVLALVVLIDVAGRAGNLSAHYTDGGVLSRRLLLEDLNPWRWSVMLANGTAVFGAIVFLVTAAAAVAMMVGYRTRLATVIVWVLVVSIQVRNPMLLSGADTLLRVLLFWSMLLPLGAWWSVDRRRLGRPAPRSMQVLSFATAGLLLQIAFMYWFTAILKSGDEWRGSGTALQYAFGARHVTRDLGEYLFQFDGLLKVLTHVSLWLEFVAPVLLFLPIFTGPVRTFAAFSIMAFQLGIMLTFDIGIFPWTSSLCMVCFLPAWFWDRVLPQAQEIGQRLRDAVAGTSLVRLSAPRVREVAAGILERYREPVTAQEDGGMDGSGRVFRTSPLINGFAAFCLVFILGWNIAGVSDYRMPDHSSKVAFGLGIYQHWNMFAPRPTRSTIWYVYNGTLADGTEVDVLPTILRGDLNQVQLLSWDEPEDISGGLYGDKYWRKYLDAIASGSRDERLAFGGYICRTWNGHYGGGVALERVEIVRMVRPTSLDGDQNPVRRNVIYEFTCT